MSQKYIGLLDCNNFFVSCERLFRPDLRRKPVVVLSSNDGCVVARSQEIKDNGIPMGVPYFQIKDILQEIGATAFSSHFALYRDISRRVFEVVRMSYDDIEQYSIDESFFTLKTDNPEREAWEIKRQVEQLVGIPVSVGVSLSKTQAKYANTVAKRTGGVALWDGEKWQQESPNIKLKDIWGVGASHSRSFAAHGLLSVTDLLSVEPATMGKLFGVEGVRLQAELKGEVILPVQKRRVAQKSIMSTRSFGKTTHDITVLEDSLSYHLYQAVKDLEAMDLLTATIRIMILPSRHGDYAFYGASKEAVFTTPTRDLFVLQKVVKELLLECYQSEVPYKKAGVVLGNLVSPLSQTGNLFVDDTTEGSQKTADLSKTLFAINNKHGKAIIQLGRTEEKVVVWGSKKDAISPSYTTHWSELRVVSS